MTVAPAGFAQLHAGRDEKIIDPDLPIIDAHHHLFIRPAIAYMLDDYLADARAGHRIVASVYVETNAFAYADGPEILRPLGEVAFANGVAEQTQDGDCRVCAAIVGHADLRHGDAVGEYLDRAMAMAPRRFRGIRQVGNFHPTEAPYHFMPFRPPCGLLGDAAFRAGFRQLAARGLVFDAAVFHHQLDDVMALADDFPETTIVLNHCGQAIAMEGGEAERQAVFQAWRVKFAELARRANVMCKVGGLGLPFWGFDFMHRQDAIGYEELAAAWRPYVETSIEAFGAARCMMESDYPPDSRSCGFVPLWNALKHITHAASPAEKRALYHDTAVAAYRIEMAR